MMVNSENSPEGNTIQQIKKEDILDLVGGTGPWQWRIFLILLLLSIPNATFNMVITFLAPNVDHWCTRPPDVTNLSVEQWRKIATPLQDQKCSRYEHINFTHPLQENTSDKSASKVIPCESWEYDETTYTSTIINEWDLVCNHEWLVSMSKSIYMVGILVSVTIIGYFSDKMGRRPAITASGFIAILSAIIAMVSTSFAMFVVARFFIAFGIAGCYHTSFVLLMEIVGPDLRPFYGLGVQFGWCIGYVSLPLIAWLLRDWFWIQIAITLPCLPLLVLWWIIPESPRWLLSKGNVERAYEILSRIAEGNRVKMSDIDTTLKMVMMRATEVNESKGNDGNILDLLRTPGLRQITFNVYFIWFVNSFVYFGLSYNTNELAGDPFINFAISGAVEFPAYFLSIFAIRSLGRRNPLAATMVIGGLACLLSYFLPHNPWWIAVAVSMIGKFCITSSFGIIFVYTTELFPTVVRNIGLGSASFCARVGSILAPFIRELGNATHPVVPQIVFGVLAATSGAFVLFLPETNNCIVPDTFKEAAEASRRKTKKSKLPSVNHITTTTLSTADEAPQGRTILNGQAVMANQQPNGKDLAEVFHCHDGKVLEITTTDNAIE